MCAFWKKPTTEPAQMFGQWLVDNGVLSTDDLKLALNTQLETKARLGEVLISLRLATEKEITRALSAYLEIEWIELADQSKIDLSIARLVSESIAKRYCMIALWSEEEHVVVAMSDPLNIVAIDTIKQVVKRPVKIAISSANDIQKAIEAAYHGSDLEEQRLRDLVESENFAAEGDLSSDLLLEDYTSADISSEDEATKAPVIRFVDLLLSQAVKSRASDIHVEPQEHSMVIRMRIDGRLKDMVPPSRKMQAAVLTRIKILSQMDIAERRLPQDGRFKIKASNRDIDVRVSSIPTIYGEKIVMRILDKGSVNHDIDQLQLEPKLLKTFKTVLSQPHGIVIVTGPTGSGKSTTLYSALNWLRDPCKNIVTVEDPVEYRLAGINQIQIKPDIKLDFAKCLRSILRQDPDIILVGEIRDKETVEIAIKAAMTGHLVLSTFHTNDAPSALTRLSFMGIQPYMLATALNLVIAQRLVRRVCPFCKEPVNEDPELLRQIHIDPEAASNIKLYRGKGCKSCLGTGYHGRAPIFEFLPMDDNIRQKLVNSESEASIRQAARAKGYGSLLDSGASLAMQGITTVEEVISMTFADVTE